MSTNLAGVNAAKGTVSTDAQVTAAQQVGTSVSGLDAAQTTATQVEGAPTRTIEGGELVNPVADALRQQHSLNRLQQHKQIHLHGLLYKVSLLH